MEWRVIRGSDNNIDLVTFLMGTGVVSVISISFLLIEVHNVQVTFSASLLNIIYNVYNYLGFCIKKFYHDKFVICTTIQTSTVV